MVAALYVDTRGPYPKMAGVDCWDEARDARLYDGTNPVVAHPPCTHYGRVRHLGKADDADCAPRALEQVRLWGGVLEHPAGSALWEACNLLRPIHPLPSLSGKALRGSMTDLACGGCNGAYTIEVDQVEWGHASRKRTWLYLVGVPRSALEAPPFPGREPTHRIGSSTCGRIDGTRYRPDSNLRSASPQQRRRTPPLFAEYLVRLARAAADRLGVLS